MSSVFVTPRVLPADVYDYLEFAAEAYGGVGGGHDFTKLDNEEARGSRTDAESCPHCVWGLAIFAADATEPNVVTHTLAKVGISRFQNDFAVRMVNERKGRQNEEARITFAEWCTELNIVRGN